MPEFFPKLGLGASSGMGDKGEGETRLDGKSNESLEGWGDSGGTGVSSGIAGNFLLLVISGE